MKLNIKQARAALGMTQSAFADRLDIHWTTVASWEQGRASPKPPTVMFIETLLTAAELDPKDFFEEESVS